MDDHKALRVRFNFSHPTGLAASEAGIPEPYPIG
jgi:hypothetical protein